MATIVPFEGFSQLLNNRVYFQYVYYELLLMLQWFKLKLLDGVLPIKKEKMFMRNSPVFD